MRTLKRLAAALLSMLCCLSPAVAAAQSLAAEQQLNACYTLMTLSLSEGDFEAALNYADQCLAMDELLDDALRADIYLKQGYALMYSQRFEEALAALDTCLTLLPGAADAMLLKLQTYAAMGDAQSARAQAEAYLETYPEQTDVYSTLGQLLAAAGDYAGAAEAYANYIASVEDAPASAYEMRGQSLLQMGRYEEAVADLTQAVDRGEEPQPRTHYLRAIARMQLGDNAAAIEDLDVCVAYLDAEEARMAEDAQYAAQIDADVLFSRYYRGIAHMQAGGYEAAIADFTACVEDGVNAETARFWRGACSLDVGEYAAALEDFAFCSKAGVEEESCLYYTALCHMGLEDYETAVEGFTECLARNVMSEQALYNRGMCYLQLGDTEKGQADLEASLSQGTAQSEAE